jgi:hypothetical protein
MNTVFGHHSIYSTDIFVFTHPCHLGKTGVR